MVIAECAQIYKLLELFDGHFAVVILTPFKVFFYFGFQQ
jgi:hypothetical protein